MCRSRPTPQRSELTVWLNCHIIELSLLHPPFIVSYVFAILREINVINGFIIFVIKLFICDMNHFLPSDNVGSNEDVVQCRQKAYAVVSERFEPEYYAPERTYMQSFHSLFGFLTVLGNHIN